MGEVSIGRRQRLTAILSLGVGMMAVYGVTLWLNSMLGISISNAVVGILAGSTGASVLLWLSVKDDLSKGGQDSL